MKACTKCNLKKPLFEFYKNKSKKFFDAQCKSCTLQWQKKYYVKNKEKISIRFKQYQIDNPEGFRKRNKKSRLKLRKEILFHYSQGSMSCRCCGESHYEFLALDHINENGAEDRRKHKNYVQMMRNLKKQNFPEGYQVLCHNCNYAKSFYKKCPHILAHSFEEYEEKLSRLS